MVFDSATPYPKIVPP